MHSNNQKLKYFLLTGIYFSIASCVFATQNSSCQTDSTPHLVKDDSETFKTWINHTQQDKIKKYFESADLVAKDYGKVGGNDQSKGLLIYLMGIKTPDGLSEADTKKYSINCLSYSTKDSKVYRLSSQSTGNSVLYGNYASAFTKDVINKFKVGQYFTYLTCDNSNVTKRVAKVIAKSGESDESKDNLVCFARVAVDELPNLA